MACILLRCMSCAAAAAAVPFHCFKAVSLKALGILYLGKLCAHNATVTKDAGLFLLDLKGKCCKSSL